MSDNSLLMEQKRLPHHQQNSAWNWQHVAINQQEPGLSPTSSGQQESTAKRASAGSFAQVKTLSSACAYPPQRCPFGGACEQCPARVQAKSMEQKSGDRFEQEAERMASIVTNMNSMHGAGSKQEFTAGFSANRLIISRQADAADEAAAQPTAAGGLLIEDDEEQINPNQMRKSEFLSQLRSAVSGLVPPAYESTVRRTFQLYSLRNSQSLESDIHQRVPGTDRSTHARDYISAITDQARRLAQGQETQPASSTLSNEPTGGILMMSREAGSPHQQPVDPLTIQQQLGPGQPLNSTVRGAMETAFGYDFSNVRIHNDERGASLSSRLKARAFTVGRHIAFGAGEYQPGSLLGDALIAHELAHVVQQGGGKQSMAPLEANSNTQDLYEQDADLSTMNAVAKIWQGNISGLKELAKQAVPTLRSGVNLQRCTGERCPQGYTWTVTNRAQLASACDCTWECRAIPSSGPQISDPNARRLVILPGSRHTIGSGGGLPGRPGYCLCAPLRDENGNILGNDSPLGGQSNQDYTGAASGAAGMRGQRYQPPQTTDLRPRPAEIRPAQPVPRTQTPARQASPSPQATTPPTTPPAVPPTTTTPSTPARPPATTPAPTTTPRPAAPVTPGTGSSSTPQPLSFQRSSGLTAAEASRIQALRQEFNLPPTPTASQSRIVGILRAEDGREFNIHSGQFGGPSGGTHRGGIPRGPGSGADRFTVRHVEGHAAAIMREQGIQRAWLLIELPPCPACGGYDRGGADARTPNLSSMLPRGAQLLVIDPNSATYFRSTE